MKTRYALISSVIFLLLFAVTGLFSQSVFKVFILKGGASVMRASDSKVVNLKVGDNLYQKDKLMLKGDVYLVLNHSNGSSFEIKKGGTYSIKDIEAKVKNKGDALLKKYSGFVTQSITNSSDNQGYTGGLERGLFANDFTFLMPKTTKILNKENSFNWNKVEDASSYLFIILDEDGKILYEKKTKSTSFSADLAKLTMTTAKCYYWQVLVNGDKARTSERHCIFLEPKDKDQQIKSELKKLNSLLNKKPNAIDCLVLANFYEQYGLLSDAYVCYVKAMSQAKGVKEYENALNSFILRASKYSIDNK